MLLKMMAPLPAAAAASAVACAARSAELLGTSVAGAAGMRRRHKAAAPRGKWRRPRRTRSTARAVGGGR